MYYVIKLAKKFDEGTTGACYADNPVLLWSFEIKPLLRECRVQTVLWCHVRKIPSYLHQFPSLFAECRQSTLAVQVLLVDYFVSPLTNLRRRFVGGAARPGIEEMIKIKLHVAAAAKNDILTDIWIISSRLLFRITTCDEPQIY